MSAPGELLGLAEHAAAAVGSGDGALAMATSERSLFLRFARSRATQATAIDNVEVVIAVARDGHVGRATTNGTSADALRECARAALTAAGIAARAGQTGTYSGFPVPGSPRRHPGFDEATAALDPAGGGDALRTAFDIAAAHDVEAHGLWTAGDVETAIATTDGGVSAAAADRVTDAFMKVTCIAADDRSGWASQAAVSAGDLDAKALTERAAERATGAIAARRDPVKLPPGEYPVVLASAAIAELVDWLGWCAFNGLAHVEDRGALSGRLGQMVAAPSVNIADSPFLAHTLPRAFDAEGVSKRPLPLIQDGVATNVVHDTRSAAMAGEGVRSTGHALAPGGSQWGPFPTNLVMSGGGAADEAELCASIERGVYVTRLWYTNPLQPKETLMTGVTRDGTFLIEDGRLGAPLEDMRFTDSILSILSGTEALTRTQALWGEGEFYGTRFATGVVSPAIRASSMRFTGGA